MPYLVTLAELKDYLGDAPDTQDSLLLELLKNVEAVFEGEAGRVAGAFKAAGTGRTEVYDGTGTRNLYLDYPVVTLTSVKLGYDPTAPDETLLVADKRVITYGSDSRRISRTDGGTFGRPGQYRYVQVVYDFAADQPENAKLAIKSVCAVAYRRRGSEEVKSESVGAFYSRTMIDEIARLDPFWQTAVAANRRLMMA